MAGIKRLLWLRDETKEFEYRTALVPSDVALICAAGHEVVVEKSKTRPFSDEEYLRAGAQLVAAGSWMQAPDDATIIGLKELPQATFPLIHRHIYFAHAYKKQQNSQQILSRFARGGGKLYDLEYLMDKRGHRIAAFGKWAGIVGAALAVEAWCTKELGMDWSEQAPLRPYENLQELVTKLKKDLSRIGKHPGIVITGGKGRCGKGATELIKLLGLNPNLWGRAETSQASVLRGLTNYDIFINCILAGRDTMPFLTENNIDPKMNLSVISDVSCDPTGPYNPLPFYDEITTLDSPSIKVCKNLDLIAIDHLPSLLPMESSTEYSNKLTPYLLDYLSGKIDNTPWGRSLEYFYANLDLDLESKKLEPEDLPIDDTRH